MKILVVDEDYPIRGPVKDLLAREGYGVVEAVDGKSAKAILEREVPDLVLLNVRLPDGDSMGTLKGIQDSVPDIPVIIITAAHTVKRAVEAMKLGAFDYIEKPFDLDKLALTVKRALEAARYRRVVGLHVREQKSRYGLHKLRGQSKAMQQVRELISKVALGETTTVLVRGESGTGKDLVVKSIHTESVRGDKPFVNITCTALQDALLESELFGHERGSFTDAKTLKKGLLELANGGTVFFDEIGDMSPALQGKLLRMLEDKSFRRIGGMREIRVDVRVIAATNVDLERQIEANKFRVDLYYRLNAITIDVPPLRERRSDVSELVEHFLGQFAREFKKRCPTVAPAALRKLENHDWPGNVRELRNVIERAVLLGRGPIISESDVYFGRPSASIGRERGERALSLPAGGINLRELDRDLVVQALKRSGGNQTKAAGLLGLTRAKINYRMKKYGISETPPGTE